MDARLVVVGGKASRSEIKLKLPAIIGRKRDSGVMIDHKSVSRQHCEIYVRDGYLFVKDRDSSNGTFVNDQRVSESILNPGDALRIGPLTFTAAYVPAPPPPTDAAPARDSRDALMSDAPVEDSDFGGFFDDGAVDDAFPAGLGGRSRNDALVETDDSEAFGWLGAESSGGLATDGVDSPRAFPTPATPAREDDFTYTGPAQGAFVPPIADASPAAGDPLAVSPDDLAGVDREERSVFAALESPSVDLGLVSDEPSQGFLGKFGAALGEAGEPDDARALGSEEEESPAVEEDAAPGARAADEPSSHGGWADERRPFSAEASDNVEPTINQLDPWGAPDLETPAVSIASPQADSSAPAVDDWSKTSMDAGGDDPLEGLDFAFDEIEQPSVEAAPVAELPESGATAAAAPPPPVNSPLESPAVSDPPAPPQWEPSEEEAPSLDLTEPEAPLLEVVDENEELLELELIDDAPEAEPAEEEAWRPAEEGEVDEELELEVVDESPEDAYDASGSPFDDSKND